MLLFALVCVLFAPLSTASGGSAEPEQWKPVPGKLMTRWAKDVDPLNPWPEYPRPLLQRERWMNLNGLWDYQITAITAKDAPMPEKADGRILVPFPVESALSGVGRALRPDQALTYRRKFAVPDDWKGDRILLHFGAVDWQCNVSVNGQTVGEHTGGFDPFSFDITDALKAGAENEIIVTVTDPTDTGGQPRGKQWLSPHGIWYTPTSGIWQTVWLEPVPEASVSAIKVEVDFESQEVTIRPRIENWKSGVFTDIEILENGKRISHGHTNLEGHTSKSQRSNWRYWTPDDPFLYTIRVSVTEGDTTDVVTSYFAMRHIAVTRDQNGANRIRLNGAPLFQFGPLDQGFWPDGLYTPPTEEAMIFDIIAAKKMGANMLRKHVKVESQRFYHACDKLGMLVWQDIPSPFYHDGTGENEFNNPPLTEEWKKNFEREMRAIVGAFDQHPSIVMWVPWNEGWGQNDLAWSKSMVELCKKLDPTRLVNNASGWTDMGNGDVNDIHVYPGPATPTPELPRDANRAMVLGEFGGLGLPIEGHTWLDKNNWGYKSYTDKQSLTAAYLDLINQLPIHISRGLAAAVYTQTTDVEIEVNGWLTYDRAVWKIEPEEVAEATRALYLGVPQITTVVPDAQLRSQVWRYSFVKPADGWEQPGFDAAAWNEGNSGFGTKGTPGAIVETEWNTSDIWLRQTVKLDAVPVNPAFSIHHDEDCEVYINGQLAMKRTDYTTGYIYLPLTREAAKLLRIGENTIAVHCRQTWGGQYVDLGLVDIKRADAE